MSISNYDPTGYAHQGMKIQNDLINAKPVSGSATSTSLSTASGSTATVTVTNANILATDVVVADAINGTNTVAPPAISGIAVTAGQIVFTLFNISASALNGTVKVVYAAFHA